MASVVLPFMGLFPLDHVTANPAGLLGTSTLELPFSGSLLGLDAWLFTQNHHPIQSSSAVPATHQCVLGIAKGLQTQPGGTSFTLHI